MKIKRTANAGVLLTLDSTSILLDGVCKDFSPYIATPNKVLKCLLGDFPDAVAVTHSHQDHFDADYLNAYTQKTRRSVIGPAISVKERVGNVEIIPVKTRHIGKNDIEHVSFVIKGSKCVWFMGDAAPIEYVKLKAFTPPDVLIIPYAYVTTASAMKITYEIGAKVNILLHLPQRELDEYGLWDAVNKSISSDNTFIIPEIDETVTID